MNISTRTAEERRVLRERFCAVLQAAAEHRDERPGIVWTVYGTECEWVAWERQQMLDAVNAERAKRALPPAGHGAIENADRQAAGHVDYADEVALYCAEIALGIERTVY